MSALPIPSVENRLSAWESIQFGLLKADKIRIRPTITLSRAFGCEGFPLAERLQKKFEAVTDEPWNIYDKALLERVAFEEDLNPKLLAELGTTSRVLEALGLHPFYPVTMDQAFAKISRLLVQIAQGGNAIIVGQGGAILCKKMLNAYHFRLEGSREFRVKSYAQRYGISRDEAGDTVDRNSKKREKFLHDNLGAKGSDPSHFHAIFNNERASVETYAEAILAYVRSHWEEREYFKR